MILVSKNNIKIKVRKVSQCVASRYEEVLLKASCLSVDRSSELWLCNGVGGCTED